MSPLKSNRRRFIGVQLGLPNSGTPELKVYQSPEPINGVFLNWEARALLFKARIWGNQVDLREKPWCYWPFRQVIQGWRRGKES